MLISSKNNNIIKTAKSLQDKKYSKQQMECFVESEKIVGDLLNLNISVTTIFFVEGYREKFAYILDNFKGNIFEITKSVADSLCESNRESKIFAIAKIPQNTFDQTKKTLILDGLQDPTNVGALVRSAKAFGFENVIAVNSVYPYTFKVVRASMGHIFNVNFLSMNFDQVLELKKENNLKFICADMGGVNIKNFEENENLALIIGNEGNGVSDCFRAITDQTVSIEMEKSVESLNASVAGSILMYLLNK